MKSIIINSLLFIFCINLTIAQVNTEAMRGEKVNDGILNKLVVEFGFEKSKKIINDNNYGLLRNKIIETKNKSGLNQI